MSEALYIEMPARKKAGPRPVWLRLLPLWGLLLLLVGGPAMPRKAAASRPASAIRVT